MSFSLSLVLSLGDSSLAFTFTGGCLERALFRWACGAEDDVGELDDEMSALAEKRDWLRGELFLGDLGSVV